MDILITGGTGFFGKALLPYLLSILSARGSDFSLTVLSRHPESFLLSNPQFLNCPNLVLHQGDVLDKHSLPQSKKYSYIIHAATDSTHGPKLSPLSRFDQIVTGTNNLLDYSVRHDVKRLLYVSSGAVYGSQPADLMCLSENWLGSPNLADPAFAYAHGKRAAEHLCHLFHDSFGIEVVIARCFAFIGPSLPLDVHFAIGNFIRDALFSEYISVYGDGSPVRSYLYQDDLAHWLWTLLAEGIPGDTYNVGSDKPISISQLAYLVRDLIAPDKLVKIQHLSCCTGDRSRYIPDITKARRELNLDVTTPLRDAIIKTARAHQVLIT